MAKNPAEPGCFSCFFRSPDPDLDIGELLGGRDGLEVDVSPSIRSPRKASALYVATLSSSESVEAVADAAAVPAGCAVSIVSEECSAYIMLKGIMDPAAELAKLDKRFGDATKQSEDLTKKMTVPSYQEEVKGSSTDPKEAATPPPNSPTSNCVRVPRITHLGKVAPPNIEWRLSLLDRAVLDLYPPGSGGPSWIVESVSAVSTHNFAF
eukprot:1181078-Prorocentrum_minimum.AAC.1